MCSLPFQPFNLCGSQLLLACPLDLLSISKDVSRQMPPAAHK